METDRNPPNAEYVIPGEHPGVYKIEAENVGAEPTSESEPITIEDTPPGGTSAEAVEFFNSEVGYANLAEFNMCSSFTECTYPSASIGPYLPQQLGPGQRLIMTVRVGVPSGLEGSLVDQAKISGGGIASVEASAANIANANPVFGTLHFGASLTDASKVNPYTQAGGHPYQVVTEFNFEDFSTTEPQGQWQDFGAAPVHDPQQVDGNLPPGLIVNPQGVH